jgi:hypothetical protein
MPADFNCWITAGFWLKLFDLWFCASAGQQTASPHESAR